MIGAALSCVSLALTLKRRTVWQTMVGTGLETELTELFMRQLDSAECLVSAFQTSLAFDFQCECRASSEDTSPGTETPSDNTHSAVLEEIAPLPLLPTPQLPKILVKPSSASPLYEAQYPPLSAQVS